MKRFLLFAGLNDNRLFGAYSLVSDFSTEKAAKDMFEDGYAVGKYDWGQLLDTKSRRIIVVSRKNGEWEPINIGLSDIRKLNDTSKY